MCIINVQKYSMSQVNYSTWHCSKGSEKTAEFRHRVHQVTVSENTDDCWGMKTEYRMEHVVRQVQWSSPECLQCQGFITRNTMAVPGWHFADVRQYCEPNIHYFCKNKKKVTFYEKLMVKSYIKYHWNQNWAISEKSISLAWKQVLYQLCSLYSCANV
jgi:hypothetical protein